LINSQVKTVKSWRRDTSESKAFLESQKLLPSYKEPEPGPDAPPKSPAEEVADEIRGALDGRAAPGATGLSLTRRLATAAEETRRTAGIPDFEGEEPDIEAEFQADVESEKPITSEERRNAEAWLVANGKAVNEANIARYALGIRRARGEAAE
jgi:hypothetical protein